MNDCKVSLKLCMFYILGILSVVQELSEATILGEVFGPQWGHPLDSHRLSGQRLL